MKYSRITHLIAVLLLLGPSAEARSQVTNPATSKILAQTKAQAKSMHKMKSKGRVASGSQQAMSSKTELTEEM